MGAGNRPHFNYKEITMGSLERQGRSDEVGQAVIDVFETYKALAENGDMAARLTGLSDLIGDDALYLQLIDGGARAFSRSPNTFKHNVASPEMAAFLAGILIGASVVINRTVTPEA